VSTLTTSTLGSKNLPSVTLTVDLKLPYTTVTDATSTLAAPVYNKIDNCMIMSGTNSTTSITYYIPNVSTYPGTYDSSLFSECVSNPGLCGNSRLDIEGTPLATPIVSYSSGTVTISTTTTTLAGTTTNVLIRS